GYDYVFTDTPASINLKGRAATTVGVNVGVMWDISSRWTVGASFRSKMNLTVKSGDASVKYANEIAESLLTEKLNILNQANFTSTMPAVAVLNLGVSYKALDALVLAFDLQWNGWSAYNSLDIDFLSQTLAPYNQHLEKNYHNSLTYRLGAQYSVSKRFDVRAGMMIDTSPVNNEYYNPETPGMTKIEPSVGFSFSPISNFAIDATLQYVAGVGTDGRTCVYKDLLTNNDRIFRADYSVYAWNPSIGLRFSF
ncbi:MAG: outer membrane protein transport protein, partial [Muribaculaceae bacterium]|nr:outer membrane protein transport protein [Muribaculaceae bacterium]